VYDRTLFWPAAAQNAVLLTLTPLLLALGEPAQLLSRALPAHWLHRSRVMSVLSFPMVSALLGVAATLVLYLSPLFRLSLTNNVVHQLVWLMLVALGCLFCWPMLSDQLLPDWCGYPMRMAFGFVDGLLDAIPGIIVMTGHGLIAGGYYAGLHRGWGPSLHWDQTIGGGLMLTIAEATAVPFAVALFFRWARADEANARRGDLLLAGGGSARAPIGGDSAASGSAGGSAGDAGARSGVGAAGDAGAGVGWAGGAGADGGAARAVEPDEPLLQRPWWESDPGPLADRNMRRNP
jgi:putative copper resistance protein D